MLVPRINRCRAVAVDMALVMTIAFGALLFNGFNPAPTPTPQPALPFTAEQLIELHEQGLYFMQVDLPEIGLPLLRAAYQRSAQMEKNSALYVRLASGFARELASNGRPDEAESVLRALVARSEKVPSANLYNDLLASALDDVALRHALTMAYAYLQMGRGQVGEAKALAIRAGLLARTQGDLAAEAEALLLEAQALFEMNQIASLAEKGQDALARFRVTGQPILETKTRLLISRMYRRAGNYRLAQNEYQKALDVIPDYSVAPMLDLESNAANLDRIRVEHHELAIRGQYHTARNEVIALLNIQKNASVLTAPEMQEKIRAAQLFEGPLTVYLTHYTHAMGAHYTAGELLHLARSYEDTRPGSRVRAEYAWAMGRLLFDLDDIGEAERQLLRAEQLAAQMDEKPDFLKVGISELRSFVEMKKGNAPQALAAMEKAMQLAGQGGMSERFAFQKNLLQRMRSGAGALDQFTSSYMVDAAAGVRAKHRRELETTAQPSVFRSVFVEDYEKMESAGDIVLQASLVRPTPPPVSVKLSAADRMSMGQYDRAIALLKEEMEAEGVSVSRLMMLGSCYYQLRKWAEAKAAYQQVLELEADNLAAQQRLSFIEKQLNQ